eukprot:COSAG02_NODE_5821_length_4014_cov_70.069476_2_plen_155_part_00
MWVCFEPNPGACRCFGILNSHSHCSLRPCVVAKKRDPGDRQVRVAGECMIEVACGAGLGGVDAAGLRQVAKMPLRRLWRHPCQCLARRGEVEVWRNCRKSGRHYGYRLVDGYPSGRSPRVLWFEPARTSSRKNDVTVAAIGRHLSRGVNASAFS